ncbi:hypothetical protein QYE76_022141 [Lolium multiflorum]|uniref:Uncharacterized protein n=1 Tax=Lolium multiflorum TaxID=4521 RepID=A0AAD8VRJ3_LOLMU|nr:hypothetical protein QYE76_022141 [Lolium multiflorum]
MGKPRDTKIAILPSTTRKGTTLSTSAALDSPSVISKLVSPPQASNAGTSAESENSSHNCDDASAVLDNDGSLGSFLDATIAKSRQIENTETPNENAATPVNSPESVEYSSDDLDEDYVELDDDFIEKCNATTDARKIKKLLAEHAEKNSDAEELLAKIGRNHDDWSTIEPTPTPIVKKRGMIKLNDEDMREAKKSLKEKGIKPEDVKNLPPIEDICETIPPSSMIEVHSLQRFTREDIPYSKPPAQCLDEFDNYIVKQENFNMRVENHLMENSRAISELHGIVERTSNDVKILVKHFQMVQTQIDQLTKVQNDLLGNNSKEKHAYEVTTRGGVSTQDPLYPEGHPKRVEQDSQLTKTSAPSKKKKKKHKNVVESSEPVNDPNSISISDAETESGNEHEEDNDKDDTPDKEEVEKEPEKPAKNKKYTKEDFIAEKHGNEREPWVQKQMPFPAKKLKSKEEEHYNKFCDWMKPLFLQIPLTDAIKLPPYSKYMKDIVTNKRKIPNEEISTMLANYSFNGKIPKKLGDPGIGQVARPCDPHRRATRRLCGPSLQGPGPASPSHSRLYGVGRSLPPVGFDVNTFSHAGGTHLQRQSSTTTISPSTSEMAKSTPVEYEDRNGKVRALREADLIGSSHDARSHGVNTVDLSHSIREPGFSFDANMAGFVIRQTKQRAATLVAKRRTRPFHVTGPRTTINAITISHTTDATATAEAVKEIIGLMQTGGIVGTTTGMNGAPGGGPLPPQSKRTESSQEENFEESGREEDRYRQPRRCPDGLSQSRERRVQRPRSLEEAEARYLYMLRISRPDLATKIQRMVETKARPPKKVWRLKQAEADAQASTDAGADASVDTDVVQEWTTYEQRHPESYQDKCRRATLIEKDEDEGPARDQEFTNVEWTRGAKPVSCKGAKQPGPAKGFDFDLSKTEQIFDWLLKEKQLKLPDGHRIPTLQEITGQPYCKWHDTFTHATNDCEALRGQIQVAIEQGRLLFDQFARKVDTQPAPEVNMVNLSNCLNHERDGSSDVNGAGLEDRHHEDEPESSRSREKGEKEADPHDRPKMMASVDLEGDGKLGYGFTSADGLEEIKEVKKEIKKLLDAGFIRPCRHAERISNVIPVEKKDGRWRVSVDFRNLNIL